MILVNTNNIADKLELTRNSTGHCFCRSFATIAADAGAELMAIKRNGQWTLDATAQGYVDNTKMAKISVANIF